MNWKTHPKIKDYLPGIEFAVILPAAAILVYILIIKPVIGLADSGDFSRIMNTVGLEHLSYEYRDRYFGYFNRNYAITHVLGFPSMVYASSQLFIVKAAMLLDFLISWDRIFDIRVLGIIYSGLYLTAVYLLIRYNKPKTFAANVLLVVFTLAILMDVGYVSFFNSLYGEAISLIFLLMTLGVGFYLTKHPSPSRKLLRLFLACALMLVGAKVQNSPIGLLVALFFLRLLPLHPTREWKRSVITSAVILTVFSVSLYAFSVPPDIRVCNKYQTVFFGILRNSPSPEKDLAALGLRQDLAVLSGTNFFMNDLPVNIKNPAFLKEIYQKIDHKKVLAFYATHPERFLDKLQVTAENSFSTRPGYLGNYEKSIHAVYQEKTNTFAYWSNFKNSRLPKNFIFVALILAIYFLVLGIHYIRAGSPNKRLQLDILLLLGLTALTQFVIPILGDGEADLSKHLFLFNACFDLILVIGVVWIADTILYHIKSKKL